MHINDFQVMLSEFVNEHRQENRLGLVENSKLYKIIVASLVKASKSEDFKVRVTSLIGAFACVAELIHRDGLTFEVIADSLKFEEEDEGQD